MLYVYNSFFFYIISNVDPDKTFRLNGISAIFIKKCSFILAAVLSKLYNIYLAASCSPHRRKSSSVVPVLRALTNRLSLRIIRLRPLFGKILEILINSQLVKHLTSQIFLSDKQYDFHCSKLTDLRLFAEMV